MQNNIMVFDLKHDHLGSCSARWNLDEASLAAQERHPAPEPAWPIHAPFASLL